MRSPRAGVSTRKSNVPGPGRVFRSEMERQLLAIQDAFSTAVNDNERRQQDLEDQLRRVEQQKKEAEDRLRSIERQKQDVENQLHETARQLRKLQKTLPVRIIRLFKRLNPLRSMRRQTR